MNVISNNSKILIIIIAVTVLLSSCSPLVTDDNNTSDNLQILPGDTNDTISNEYTLYYRIESANALTQELRTLTIPESKSTELALIQELIAGTQSTNTNIGNLFDSNTRVLSVSGRDNILFVTLSRHFMNPPAGFDDNWEDSEDTYNQVVSRRKLALYSIVNTITELGGYSYVQFYIDYDNNGTGTRPTNKEMGIEEEDDNQLIEPLSRNTELIFSPSAAVHAIMNYIGIKEWYGVLMYTAFDSTEEDDTDNIIKQLDAADFSLLEYTIHNQSVALDGKSAVIVMSYKSLTSEGTEDVTENISVRLVRENGVWKCSITSLYQIIQ